MEDVKIKTGFGGMRQLCFFDAFNSIMTEKIMAVTLVSLSLILSLTLYEFVDYRRVHMVSLSQWRKTEPP